MQKRIWHNVEKHPELKVGQYVVPNFISNSVLLEVDDKNIVVVSPGKSLLENCSYLAQAEDIHLHIYMPNGYHFLGVDPWKNAFPKHSLYASKQAIAMLENKLPKDVVGSINELESNPPPLPENYEVVIPPRHRGGDAWLVKTCNGETTWITCDSFLNYDRLSNQPIARFLQRLLNAAPGLKISKVIKYLILSNRRAFKHWALDRLQCDNLTTLIPSHGEVNQSAGLKDDLQKLIQKQL
jgi:hypothetical protein